MNNLEQTVENGFLDKVRNYVGSVRSSVASKVALYSLAGTLVISPLYLSCEECPEDEKQCGDDDDFICIPPDADCCGRGIDGELGYCPAGQYCAICYNPYMYGCCPNK